MQHTTVKEDLGKIKQSVLTEIVLKNVTTETSERDITVNVVSFDKRNNQHTRFVFDYSDMLQRIPSSITDMTHAAQVYVDIFMARKEDDATNKDSDYNCVRNDMRAARTLLNNSTFQKAVFDFFENA